MTVERSKLRCFLTLTFIVKSVSKNLLIRIQDFVPKLVMSQTVHDCNKSQNSEYALKKSDGVVQTWQ